MSARGHPFLVALLGLPALLYSGAVRLRNRFYERAGASRRADLPVISVGNLTVGGTGKTPVVAWLAEHLLSLGLKPAIVSRGYAGRSGRGPLLVSDGAGPQCPPAVSGDEPYLLAQSLPGSIVVVGSDRVAGASHAGSVGADAILLDDGFQHRRLARDLDIVLLDATDPFGGHRLLPAGRLREPVSGLRRAGLVLITRARPGQSFPEIERIVRRHNRSAPLITAGHDKTGFVDHRGDPAAVPARAVAFCGIGNPGRFRSDLESRVAELIRFRAYRDHHRFTTRDLERLARLAGDQGATLVTTEKDLVRLRPLLPPGWTAALLALRIRAVIHEPRPLIDSISRVLRRGAA